MADTENDATLSRPIVTEITTEEKDAVVQANKPLPPKTPPAKAAKVIPVAAPVAVKPSGPPHPGAPPNAGSAEDPTGENFVAWVKADMAHKQAQH